MLDADRWAHLDALLPRPVRTYLEERFWRPIVAQATLEILRDDPSFFADPGRHPAMFADHGVVHARDVAESLVRLVDAVDGVLLASRPPERRRFLEAYGVAAAYLHDIGMVDMSPAGRRTHALYAAHAAFQADVQPLVDHLLGPGPVGDRLAAVAAGPDAVPRDLLVRELLSLAAAHSKSTIPAPLLDDRAALRRVMQRIVFTSLDALRAAPRSPAVDDPSPLPLGAHAERYPDPAAAYAWLAATHGPQAELADDVLDAVRALRAADVLRQRGTELRTSGGFEVCFDAATAHAVCTMRSADGATAYVVTYADRRGAGEANISVASVTPQGHLRIAFHRGAFADGEVARRAALSVAEAVMDIAADVLPAFDGAPARGLPAPSMTGRSMRIELERPDDRPAFADAVARCLAEADPGIGDRVAVVANVEAAAPAERARYHASPGIDPDDPLVEVIVRNVADHGTAVEGLDRVRAFTEARLATIRSGEELVAKGSPPAFVYVPIGGGLVVRPGGGYAPSPLAPWVPVGTTGVIRRAERNSDIVAEREVVAVMIPAERYAQEWLRPLTPEELRARLGASVAAE